MVCTRVCSCFCLYHIVYVCDKIFGVRERALTTIHLLLGVVRHTFVGRARNSAIATNLE